jgi:N6-adenosine-specific RNA methylase IME4
VTWEGLTPPYSTVVVDPPWHYERSTMPNPHLDQIRQYEGDEPLPYSSMTLDEIKALPVSELGDDMRVFMWVTNRYLRLSWSILEAWGLEAQTKTYVWCKPPMGTVNVTTEFVVVGKKGRPPTMPWWGTTWFNWQRPPKQHSAKPAAFFDLVEEWCPGPYVELFARQPRLGWSSWGLGYEGR